MENKYLLALKKEYEGTQRAAAEARASLDSMEQQIGHADGEIQKLSEETSRVKERRMTALTRNADIIEENDRLRHEIKELQSNTGIAVSLKALRLKIDETTAGTEDLRKHNEERLRQIRVDFELQLAEIRKGAPTDADDDDEEEHDENAAAREEVAAAIHAVLPDIIIDPSRPWRWTAASAGAYVAEDDGGGGDPSTAPLQLNDLSITQLSEALRGRLAATRKVALAREADARATQLRLEALHAAFPALEARAADAGVNLGSEDDAAAHEEHDEGAHDGGGAADEGGGGGHGIGGLEADGGSDGNDWVANGADGDADMPAAGAATRTGEDGDYDNAGLY